MHNAMWRAVIIIAAISIAGCFNQPLEPVAPSWTTSLSMPLFHRSYSLADLASKDTSMLRAGTGGQILYTSSVESNSTPIGDLITLSLPDTSLRVKFGAFALASQSFTLPVPFPWLPQGATVPVPDTTVAVADLRDTIGTFQSVTFEHGTISLTLQNNLPVVMQVVQPLQLIDSHGSIVATFVFGPAGIAPNSSETAADSLAGRTLTSIVTLSGIRFHTSGSPTPVTIPFGTLISAHLNCTNLKARQAVFATVPAQRLTDNDTTYIRISDSTLVQELRIGEGSFDLNFTNNVQLEMLFRYKLPELQKLVAGTYVPYEDSISLPVGGSGTQSVNLASSRIRSVDGQLVQSLRVISSVILPTGSAVPVTVHDTDRVVVHMTRTQSIVADSVVGVLKPTWVALNKVVPMNFGDLPTRFTGRINLPAAVLAFWTNSSVNFPMDVSMRIAARKPGTQDSAFLAMPMSSKRLAMGTDLILFDQGDVGAFLSQFSGGLPSELRIEGRALVNPPDVYVPSLAGVGSAGRNSAFGGRADVEIPLMMSIADGSYRDSIALGDTTADGRKDYIIDKKQINSVNAGNVVIEIRNAMPVQIGFSLHLLDSTKTSILTIPQSGSELLVSAAAVDGNGNVTIPANSAVSFELNREEVQQFIPAEYFSFALSVITTPGAPAVRFRMSDSVQVRVWSTLAYKVNG
jgi:hypothetical protein